MSYDYRYLQSVYPYDPVQLEKVCRISDTLERITQIPFLGEHLSLYGGTALNYIHFPEIQRLSVDIDYNYRHQGEETDWGDIRSEIDENIKRILASQGYNDTAVKIDASYPLCRFIIEYTNHQNIQDSFKIETGYMKRMPILTDDAYHDFIHIGKETRFKVKTPQTEEIYANKIITMLDRATPRDLYDVASISETSTDQDTIRKCVIIESLMSLKQPITEIDPIQIIGRIPYDDRIRTVSIQTSKPNIKNIRQKVTRYTSKIIDSLTENEKQCIQIFYKKRQFKPELLETNQINPEIQQHPGILRAQQKQ
ncbi:hypothetical protein GF326_12785 [Candidatus Bathyarchaeota archaeon]|nr:hypothetical protein [Candidatus Bathyarchaeota archaeon]